MSTWIQGIKHEIAFITEKINYCAETENPKEARLWADSLASRFDRLEQELNKN